MKLIKPKYEILKQKNTLQGVYKQIELAGRTCYKSEDKITNDSAEKFVNMLIERKHFAMLEHGTVYLDFLYDKITKAQNKYLFNPYSKVYPNTLEEDWEQPHLYVTTNYRVLYENGWLDDLKYLCKPTIYHERRYSVKLFVDRGITHELVRSKILCFA